MNPDGSNQREVTSELVPVSGFDVTGDGSTIAYAAGGVVKRMSIGGDSVQVTTAAGAFEYAPIFTPDGTAMVVARRDSTGADDGYWRIPTVSGADPSQVTTDGAPNLGSVALRGDELTNSPGAPSWAPRIAFSADGKTMLVVRGADDKVELVDMTNTNPPLVLGLSGNSAPIWEASSGAFYIVATPDQGATWSYFQVTTAGVVARVGAAAGDLAVAVNGGIAFVVGSSDGSNHLAFAVSATSTPSGLLTSDPTWSEGAPSFSPDGSLIVFGRFGVHSPTVSDGIWIVAPNGSGLTKLATDGAYPRWLP
jgi:Tol biopolymer transport system component